MAWQLALTDVAGRNVALLGDYQSFTITSVLNGPNQLAVTLDAADPAAAQLAVGERAVKAYQDGVLRFYGKVWEPLRLTSSSVVIVAKDPYAEFAQRRVRTQAVWSSEDAGNIALSRVTIQNGYLNTFLAPGVVQVSVPRARTFDPGKLEGEIVQQLAEVANGYFFRTVPVDSNPLVMGRLNIYYPNAGTTREEVRFEYGPNTRDNLEDYDLAYGLPLNRFTAASSNPAGGRISAVGEDVASQTRFGLFENEQAFSDVSVVATLTEHAAAEVEPLPPLTVACTPSLGAPLLFTQFDVGDFVRFLVTAGSLDTGLLWVRVLEAGLSVDVNGSESLTGLSLEYVTGGTLNVPPDARWRAQHDNELARLEALERRVENIVIPSAPPPPPPAPSGGGGTGDSTPPPDTTPPPPPPPAPARAPLAVTLSASSFYDSGLRAVGVTMSGMVTPRDADTDWWFDGHRDPNAPEVWFSAGARIPASDNPMQVWAERMWLAPRTDYWIRLVTENANGRTYGAFIHFVSTAP